MQAEEDLGVELLNKLAEWFPVDVGKLCKVMQVGMLCNKVMYLYNFSLRDESQSMLPMVQLSSVPYKILSLTHEGSLLLK